MRPQHALQTSAVWFRHLERSQSFPCPAGVRAFRVLLDCPLPGLLRLVGPTERVQSFAQKEQTNRLSVRVDFAEGQRTFESRDRIAGSTRKHLRRTEGAEAIG